MESIMRHFADDMAPGDVFIMNDPFDGGMHLPDIFIFKPLYHEGERLAFACTVCHHTDVGGRVAGSNASDSTEIYAEGLRIAPMKLYEAGKLNKTIMTFIEKNVRLPVQVFGDLRAQLAACHIAEKQFAEIVARYGPEQTKFYLKEIIDYAERLTRAALAELPDGEWSFEDWIDDDGVDYGQPIRLFVTIRKQGDHMVVDWTGTNPQVKGAINNTLSYTKAAAYTGVRSVLPPGIPNNEGVFRAIEVICPPGTVGNGVLPAACAARGLTGFRMVDCMFGALAMMLPDKVKAAGDGGNTGISIGGYDAQRKPFVYVDFTCGAWGARPWADGLDGNSHMFANMASHSIEVTEAEHPIQLDRVRVRARQGRRRQIPRRRAVPARLSLSRARRRAAGALRPARSSAVRSLWRQPGRAFGELSQSRDREPRAALQADHDDQARRRVPPCARPARAAGAIRSSAIPRCAARCAQRTAVAAKAAADYGVIVDRQRWTVDAGATARRRDEIRSRRGWTDVPKVQRHDPIALRARGIAA
jgi:N-methylhydantoinase B